MDSRKVHLVRPASASDMEQHCAGHLELPQGDGQKADTSLGELLRFCICISFLSPHLV